MTYQVMCETNEGTTHILRKGFATKDAALDHPVRLSLWKRVWVKKSPPVVKKDESPPMLPWSVEWVGGYAYMVDSKGRKIASLLGNQKCREYVANIICALNEREVSDV